MKYRESVLEYRKNDSNGLRLLLRLAPSDTNELCLPNSKEQNKKSIKKGLIHEQEKQQT